jgi:hypothetical protein
MSDFSNDYEPTPEFLDRLGRDIDRAFRTEVMFGPPTLRRRGRKLTMALGIGAGVVLTLLVGMVLGASANHAAAAPAAPRSPLAILPIKSALSALGCAPSPVASQPIPATSIPQITAPTPQSVPVIELPLPRSRTAQTLGAVLGLRETPNGLLVNDAGRRELRLFDESLSNSTVILDSMPGATHTYPRGTAGLFAFMGDSSLMKDGASRDGMLVLDGSGHIARALPLVPQPGGPAPRLSSALIGLLLGPTFVDATGRVLYTADRSFASPSQVASSILKRPDAVPSGTGRSGGPATGASGTAFVGISDRADTLPILRMDLEARRIDTVAFVRQPPDDRSLIAPNGGGKTVLVYGKNGTVESIKQIINPLFTTDEWTVLSDGTIAIVRGHDYHVDWIHPDGTRSSSPKLPFDWKRLNADDKQRLVDSTRAAVDSADAFGRKYRVYPYEIVPLDEIADSFPPVRAGAAIADRAGNLWILPTQSATRQLTYDVVDPNRGLVRRVRLPAGRSIAGFGEAGVVYLKAGDAVKGFTIERTVLPGAGRPSR